MAKDIPLEGSNDRGDNKFEKAESTSTQINYYVGDKDSGGTHCHMYVEHESGKSGVVHRGECNVCDDQNNTSSDGGSGGFFSFLGKLFS